MFLHIHDTKQTTLSTTLLDHTFKQCQGDRLVGYWVSQGRVTFLSRRGRRLLVESSSVELKEIWSSFVSLCFVCLQNYANLFILNLETSTENKENKNTSWRVLQRRFVVFVVRKVRKDRKDGKYQKDPLYPVLILLTPWPAHLFVVLRGAFQAVTANRS